MYSTLPRTKPFLMTQLYQPAEDIVYVHWQMITHFAAEMSGMVYTTDVASPVDVLSIPLGPLPKITNIPLGVVTAGPVTAEPVATGPVTPEPPRGEGKGANLLRASTLLGPQFETLQNIGRDPSHDWTLHQIWAIVCPS